MARIAIIGGSGLNALPGLQHGQDIALDTPWGRPSSPVRAGRLAGQASAHEVFFLARHGLGHHIPPHRINYRANMQAIASLRPDYVLAVTAVGGIARFASPGSLIVPEQIIDYSHGREHTYYDGGSVEDADAVRHVDFTHPYCGTLRSAWLEAARASGVSCHDGGVYGVTQGPRLETAAEIERMRRDGCDLVGMTGMPEAGLARELGLCYANCSVVANWAAGLADGEITMAAIEAQLETGMEAVRRVLYHWINESG